MNLAGPVVRLETCVSTQDEAAARLRAGEPVGAVLSRAQTGGRGRFGRVWSGEPDASFFASLVFPLPREPWVLGMAVAVLVAETVDASVRWPNDVFVGEKKVAGVLTEVVEGFAVVGVGVNLRPPAVPEELRWRATDLETEQRLWTPSGLWSAMSAKTAIESNWRSLSPRWLARDATPGKRYRDGDGRLWTALGVGANGELIAENGGELRRILAADAWFGHENGTH